MEVAFKQKHTDCSPERPQLSCNLDRNPSPPSSDDEEPPTGDSIGDTVYSKHWFFSTLTKLIETVTEQNPKAGTEEQMVELDEDLENEICKVWDMSMNQEVALFLQEFNAPEIFLGVIAKSKCNRLTEICVGILGNMACFPETCLVISNNEDLGNVLLLLLSDSDPPTLLETSRLLLTCVSQVDTASTWVQRIRKQSSVRESLCFIMSSSTNGDLLVKVGELVDKVFDLDEDLMIEWIKAGSPQRGVTPANETAEDKTPAMELVFCLLEAAKQLRYDNPEGLDIYMHILQLMTTVDEGIRSIVQSPESAKEAWDFLLDLTCRDLCQPDDPPLIVHEQKTVLSSVLAVMSVIFPSQAEQGRAKMEKNLPLIVSLIQVLGHLELCHKKNSDSCKIPAVEEAGTSAAADDDFHLNILKDVCCEFLSNLLMELTKECLSEGLKGGQITKEKCLCALRNLLPLYATSVKHFITVLSGADQTFVHCLTEEMPSLKDQI
ncbi:LOW QUALITY PROTEIN: protein SAAL1 [Bombina bombina]|uniref:LOW QUALITY PROTEIN: protein SAAL1 n=1 Tax=Bombina bombina TaxID=8345 RepID=UPI00235A9E51|nr:LOW QUALITY PROTEIN: protein SAAL1 [Bombina bombina]